jgi:hypothetical protein
VRPERAPAAPDRTCPARLQPLLRAAEAGALAEPTRSRRRLYEQMGAQLARSGLSLGAHQPPLRLPLLRYVPWTYTQL